MKVEILWKGCGRVWAVVNNGGQIIRDSFLSRYDAYAWACLEQYEVSY